jgi:3-deoxy-D-manno-octulosonic acid kinase
VSPGAVVLQREGGARLGVVAAWQGRIAKLELLSPGALERWLAGAPSAGQGRAATALASLPDAGPRLAVRRLRHGGWLGPWLGERYLGAGRALRELEVTVRLRAAGAPVPEPVFAFAHRRGVFFRQALATVYEAGSVDGLAFLAAAPEPTRLLRAAAACGAAARRFHDAGGRHADLHLKNLLVRETAGGTEAIVIDLDRAAAGTQPSPARRARELGRLWRSLVKRGVASQVGERGLSAFLSAYCAGDDALREALARRWRAERRKAAVHALLYRR